MTEYETAKRIFDDYVRSQGETPCNILSYHIMKTIGIIEPQWECSVCWLEENKQKTIKQIYTAGIIKLISELV